MKARLAFTTFPNIFMRMNSFFTPEHATLSSNTDDLNLWKSLLKGSPFICISARVWQAQEVLLVGMNFSMKPCSIIEKVQSLSSMFGSTHHKPSFGEESALS